MRFVVTRREEFDRGDGINSFIFNLSDALLAAGHEVHLVTPTICDSRTVAESLANPRYSDLHVIGNSRTPSHWEMAAAWRSRGVRLVRDIKADFVIINGALPVRMPVPSCVVAHDLEKRWSYGGIGRRVYKSVCYRLSERIVATTSELQSAVAREIFYDQKNISVIPTCVNCEAFHNHPLERRKNAILHMGTARYKQPMATLAAFAEMTVPADLYITGKKTPFLDSALDNLPSDVRKRVFLLGIVPAEELRDLLATVRVVSVPSLYVVPVASPTVLESFSSGTPVVTTPSVSRDLFAEGRGGYRVDPNDTKSFAHQVECLLCDDVLWTKNSTDALAAAEQFRAAAIAAKYVALASGI